MLAIIKHICDSAAVGAEGKPPAHGSSGVAAGCESHDPRAAKKQRTSGSGAAATAPAGKEALPSVGIAKEWSVTVILQVVAYLVREVLGITTPRELHQAIMSCAVVAGNAVISAAFSSASWTFLVRQRWCSSIWANASRRQGWVREAAQCRCRRHSDLPT
jgi:hypothetical protein